MRVLLDECLLRRLGRLLVGHALRTVPEAGWAHKRDSEILRLARGHFDIFATMDRGVAYQNTIPPDVAVLTLRARSNRLESLRPLVPAILEALASIRPGEQVSVGSPRLKIPG